VADKSILEFGAEELRRALEIISDSLAGPYRDRTGRPARRVRELVSCDYVTCCMKRVDAAVSLPQSVKSLPGNFPSDWLIQFLDGRRASAGTASGGGRTWPGAGLRPKRLFICRPSIVDLVHRARDHGLVEGITLTVASPPARVGSLFSFSGRAIEDPTTAPRFCSILPPHLHSAVAAHGAGRRYRAVSAGAGILDWVGARKDKLGDRPDSRHQRAHREVPCAESSMVSSHVSSRQHTPLPWPWARGLDRTSSSSLKNELLAPPGASHEIKHASVLFSE